MRSIAGLPHDNTAGGGDTAGMVFFYCDVTCWNLINGGMHVVPPLTEALAER